MLRFIKISSLAIALSVSFGCTKKAEVTSVSMQMPDWSKLTQKNGKTGALSIVKVVDRVMINISGPDIPTPIVYIWQLDRDNLSSEVIPTPPAEFELTVPRGSSRLIQVLTLIQDYNMATQDKEGEMVFYYGDVTKNLVNAVEPVNIALAVASNSTGEGSISGRYFNADGSTPTGVVHMYFAPPGKNPMIVERTSIFSGYFNFFLLPDVPFTYRLENGAVLFNSITTASFATSLGGRAMYVSVPQGYREHGGGGSRSFVSPRGKILGFFGPGATLTTREMCFPTSVVAISGFYDAAVSGDPIYWNYSSANQADARVINGGTASSGGLCAGGGTFGTQILSLNTNRLIYGDSPLPMRGPFQEFTQGSYSSFLNVTQTGATQLLVDWEYLPGVVGSSVDGVGIFYRVFGANENLDDEWHDSAPCNKLSEYGYSELTRVAAGAAGGPPVSTYTWNTNANIISGRNAGRLKTLICPYTNAKSGYYDFAVTHYNSSGYTPTATQIMATSLTEPSATYSAATPHRVARQTCTAIRVRMADFSGKPAPRAESSDTMTVNVDVGGAMASLFEDANCTQPMGGVSSLDYGLHHGFETVIFVRGDLSQTTDYQLTISDVTAGGTPLPSLTHHIRPVTPAPVTHLLAMAATNVVRWQCYPYTISSGVLDGMALVANSPISAVSISLPNTAGLEWYYDSNCMTHASPGTFIDTNSSMTKRYFRYTALSNSMALAPVSDSEGLTRSGPTLQATDPAAPTRLRLEGIGSTYSSSSSCVPIRLVAFNQLGQVSPTGSPQNISVSFSNDPMAGEGLFSDSSCTPGNEVSTVSLNLGQAISTTPLYFRWNITGPLSILGTGGTLPFETLTTEVQP